MSSVEYSDAKPMSGYSSNQTSAVAARDHGWHSAGHTSSKQHSYGASGGQWSSRGTTAPSAAPPARSDWSGRGSGSSSAAGGAGSFASSAKNAMGSGAASASSRAAHDPRYDAYKQLANSATRRY